MVDVTTLLLTPVDRLLCLMGLVAAMGLAHELIAVRKLWQTSCRQASGLIVVALVYTLICVAFVAFSELSLVDFESHLGSLLPATVEASLLGDAVATVVCFAFSWVLSNTSMYDAYWSVLPPVIGAYWWFKSFDFDPDDTAKSLDFDASPRNSRRYLQMGVYIVWALRLTYNWARGWPGLHHVDWRYVPGAASPQPFSQREAPVAFWAMSFFSFHLYPTVAVFIAMVPSSVTLYAASSDSPAEPLNILDLLAFVTGIGAAVLQHVADNQMFEFRNRKNKRPEDVMVEGVWGYSRHPNYLGENMHWWAHYLFALAATGGSLSMFYIACPLSITILFLTASIPMMEKRMLLKRPSYQGVIDNIPMLIPFTKY